jgi:hypothetical protein
MEFKEKVTAMTAFSIIVSCSYLFGYWGAFNINILEFGNLIDLAKLAIFPMLTGLIFFLAGTLSSEIMDRKHLQPGGGNHTRIGQFGLRHGRLLVAGQITLITCISIFGPEPWKWALVAFFIALLSTPITYVEFIIELFPDPTFRARILYWILLLPAAAFAYGRIDAYQTKEGHATRVVDVTRSGLPLVANGKEKVAYLGFAGGFHILYEAATGSGIFSKQKDDVLMVIVPNYETTLLGKPPREGKTSPASSPQTISATSAVPSAKNAK